MSARFRNWRSLRPIRPTPLRDLLYQLIVLAASTALLIYTPTSWVHGWPRWFVFLVCFLVWSIPFTLTISSWAGGLYRVKVTAKNAIFHLRNKPGQQLFVLFPGFGVGPEVYTGAPLDRRSRPESFAAVFEHADQAVMLVELAWVYDERRLFAQLHEQFQSLGHPLVKIVYHSMTCNMHDPLKAWLDKYHPVRNYRIDAELLLEPAFVLRGVQKVMLRMFRPYKGGPILQAIWSRTLWKFIWPENKIVKARCETDGRMDVYNLLRYLAQVLSVDLMLHNMSAMVRRSKLRSIRQAPTSRILAVDFATDEVVVPGGNEAALVRRYGSGNFVYWLITGRPEDIGFHGNVGEFHLIYATIADAFLNF